MDHGDIPAPSRLRQEDCHTKKAIHGYIAQPCLKKTKRKKRKEKQRLSRKPKKMESHGGFQADPKLEVPLPQHPED